MAQNADGTPHFAYYYKQGEVSFVWDGKSQHIQVCPGGYGEPVRDVIDIADFNPGLFEEDNDDGGQPLSWLLWFKTLCDLYLEHHYGIEVTS